MDVAGFYINPFHVAAIGEVKGGGGGGPATISVYYVGADDPIVLRFDGPEKAARAREELITAIGLTRG